MNKIPPMDSKRMFRAWDDEHEKTRIRNAIQREKQKIARMEKAGPNMNTWVMDPSHTKWIEISSPAAPIIAQCKRIIVVMEARLVELNAG